MFYSWNDKTLPTYREELNLALQNPLLVGVISHEDDQLGVLQSVVKTVRVY